MNGGWVAVDGWVDCLLRAPFFSGLILGSTPLSDALRAHTKFLAKRHEFLLLLVSFSSVSTVSCSSVRSARRLAFFSKWRNCILEWGSDLLKSPSHQLKTHVPEPGAGLLPSPGALPDSRSTSLRSSEPPLGET